MCICMKVMRSDQHWILTNQMENEVLVRPFDVSFNKNHVCSGPNSACDRMIDRIVFIISWREVFELSVSS